MTPPTKPKTDKFPLVFRGGTWGDSSASLVRAAYRVVSTPRSRDYYIGFRCAQRGSRQPLGKVTP